MSPQGKTRCLTLQAQNTDQATRRWGDKETKTMRSACFSPCLPISLSPCLFFRGAPADDVGVRAAREDRLPVGRNGDRQHRLVVNLERGRLAHRGQVPDSVDVV